MADESSPTEALPEYVIEGARSSRSKCKTCRRKIDKGSLRVGMLIEGPYGTGYLWHHLRCAARRHFERLAEAYQARAWDNAKEPPSRVPQLDELSKLRDEAEQRRRTRKTLPYAEAAPSGRSRCKHCGEPIAQGSVRIALGREVEFGGQVRLTPTNVHTRCVAEAIRADDCGTESAGFHDAVRANSTDLDTALLEAALGEIGTLD